MRIVSLLALTLLIPAGCTCSQKLGTIAPELIVKAPTVKEGDQYLLDLGTLRVGETATGLIVIQNLGNDTATVKSVRFREGSDAAFSVGGDDVPKLVNLSGSFTVIVSFKPTRSGAVEAIIDLTTTDPRLASVTVKVKGQAHAALAEVCAETTTAGTYECASAANPVLTIEYGSMLLNTPPVARKVRITSKGDAALNYGGSSFLDGTPLLFTMSPYQATTRSMAVNEEQVFSVVFTPGVDAAFAGALQVTTDDPLTPVVTIQLKALAASSLSCKMIASPTSLAFGSTPTGSSQDGVVTLNNVGSVACMISSISIVGSPTFSVGGVSAPLVLAPKTSVNSKIHYVPNGNQNDAANLTVVSDDPATPTLTVPLSGQGIDPPACLLKATPRAIDFGGVELGDRAISSVLLTAQSPDGEPCTLTGAALATPNTNFVMSKVSFGIVGSGGVGGFGGGTTVGLTYAPTIARADNNNLLINYTAGLFSGPKLTLNIPITAKSGVRRLCISPARLHFGSVGVGATQTLQVTMTACGGSAVAIQSMKVLGATSPFSLTPSPTLPIALSAGASVIQLVTVSPTTGGNLADSIEVVSDDPVFTKQLIPLDVGPQTVSADAGEVMYTWQAAAVTTTQEGTVMKTNLQGPPNRSPVYGTKAGESCSGCHTVSADGKFIALLEYGTPPTMRILDARTLGAIPIPNTGGGQYPSWNPNPKTDPPYQFVYNEGKVLKLASVTAGVIGTLPGTDDPAYIYTQPSWGPNGKIVLVRGSGTADAGDFGITGPTDLVTIPEKGGVATVVPGASGTPGENYLPEFSPNGKYIAYTYSAKGQSTRSAPDSVVQLVEVATGQILKLPLLNAVGPNSWPTWSKDGLLLSFSSTRGGGKGSADIYYAPVDQNSGVDGAAVNMSNVNTADYDHISRWAFLPPP